MHPVISKIQNSFRGISFPQAFKHLPIGLFKKAAATPSGPSTIVACDLGKSKVVIVEVEKSPQKVRLIKFQKMVRSVNGEKDADLLKKCFEAGGFSTQKLRTSVKGQGVIIRFIQFPQMKREDLRNAISFEIDQYIPFKANEVVWDFCVLEENLTMASGGGKGMNILLVAVKREDLTAYLQAFQDAGLQINLIDIDAVAVINALEFFHPESVQATVGILDIGTEISTLSIIQNGMPRFIRDISYGSFDILKRLKRKLGLSHEQAMEQMSEDRAPTPEALSVIKEGLGDLISDLRVSLNYYLDQVQSAETIKTLFVSGGVGYHPILLENLRGDLGFGVESFDIMNKIELASGVDSEMLKRNQGILSIAMGLCVRD